MGRPFGCGLSLALWPACVTLGAQRALLGMASPFIVYRWDPRTGMLTVVADDFVKPNGLAFSPDESSLYVTDSGANQ